MLSITDLKVGTKIILESEPYIVTSYSQSKQARGGSVVKVQVRNMISGAVLSKTFQGNDRIETAQIDRTRAQFMYMSDDDYHFMDNESYNQFSLNRSQIGELGDFLVDGIDVDVINFNNNPISIELKPKVELKVIETPPGVKGDTASGGSKPAKLETGITVQVPLFIKEGDVLRINTETREYVERA
jgi:elongation factor P